MTMAFPTDCCNEATEKSLPVNHSVAPPSRIIGVVLDNARSLGGFEVLLRLGAALDGVAG